MSTNRIGRFVPRIESLEARDCPAVTVGVIGSFMTVIGDNLANNIAITDNGTGGVTVTGDGQVTNATGIRTIVVRSQAGNDTFDYKLTGALRQASVLSFDLGRGTDTGKVDLSAGIQSGGLAMNFEGGENNDTLSAILGSVAAGVVAGIEVSGGRGNDSISFAFTGELDGLLAVEASGQDGDDPSVTGSFDLAAGSTGRLVTKFAGGKGNDTLSLQVKGATSGLALLSATLDGDDGFDTGSVVGRVRVREIELIV